MDEFWVMIQRTAHMPFLRGCRSPHALRQLRAAIAASTDLPADLRRLLEIPNWRPHLLAAAAAVAVPEQARPAIDAFWARIAEHSWAVPQLAAAAYVLDPEYALSAHLRIRALLDASDAATGWNRSVIAKNATALAAFLDPAPNDPRFAALSADGDYGGLAQQWLAALQAALALPPDTRQMTLHVLDGDLLDQDVDVLVNAWNRNVIPWWLLLPQGVSGAIKKRAGYAPFQELGWKAMPLGSARLTSAGRLPHRAIIHVAGIDLTWRASAGSVRDSVTSAVGLALEHGFVSIAFPVLGAGSGGLPLEEAEQVMRETLEALDPPLEVRIVRWRPS